MTPATVNDPRRICLWSGPRNISTALMYSFAQRRDTRVVDEPLYAHYLKTSGADHPGRASVLEAMDQDSDRVIREQILGPTDRPILFMKQMAHHLIDVERHFLSQISSVLLIRDPKEVLRSLSRQLPNPSLQDTGLKVQAELKEYLTRIGLITPVLDSRELLLNPKGVLRRLCLELAIPFDPSMLSWAAGPRTEDGVWAPHWYKNVHRSSGFMAYEPKSSPFPESLEPLLEECRPYYEALYAEAIRSDPESRGVSPEAIDLSGRAEGGQN
jgi:hypothetical protein